MQEDQLLLCGLSERWLENTQAVVQSYGIFFRSTLKVRASLGIGFLIRFITVSFLRLSTVLKFAKAAATSVNFRVLPLHFFLWLRIRTSWCAVYDSHWGFRCSFCSILWVDVQIHLYTIGMVVRVQCSFHVDERLLISFLNARNIRDN